MMINMHSEETSKGMEKEKMEKLKNHVKTALDTKWNDRMWTEFIEEVGEWLLLSKGQSEDEVGKALVGIVDYGITSKNDIRNVGGGENEAFKTILATNGVPKAICESLFEQYVAKSENKKPKVSGDSVLASKRRSLNQSETGEMELFMRLLTSGEVKSNGEDSRILEFNTALKGMKVFPRKLFIRECYPILYSMMEESFNHDSFFGNSVVVMGSPGVGTTVFGVYVLYNLLRKGETVLYYHGGENVFYLLGPKTSSIIAAARDAGYEVPSPGGPFVDQLVICLLADQMMPLVYFLQKQKQLYYIHDPPDQGIKVPVGIECKVLVVSPPFRGMDNPLENFGTTYCMPVWGSAELKAANKCLDEPLSDVMLQERWERFGGVARWVLAPSEDESGQILREQVIGMIGETFMKELLDPFANGTEVKKEHSGLVVLMFPTEDFCSFTTRFASHRIFEEIRTKLQLRTSKMVFEWAKSLGLDM